MPSCRRVHLACVLDLDEALEKWLWEGLRLSLMAAEREHSGVLTMSRACLGAASCGAQVPSCLNETHL